MHSGGYFSGSATGAEGLRTRIALHLLVLATAAALSHAASVDVVNVLNSNTLSAGSTSTTTARPISANDIDSTSSQLLAVTNNTEPLPPNLRHPHAVLFSGTCGGSIISPKWILTAGHCTLFSSGRSVLAGTGHSRDGTGVRRYIKRLVIHPRFSVGPYWLDATAFNIKQVGARFDFLLAELEEPLPLDGKTIAAIPLDDQITHPAGIEVGYAGYGAAHHGETMRHTMHAMELETVSDEECTNKLVEFDKQDMICTRGRPPRFDSACNGDSGSGLVGEGRLMGVASFVEEDATTCRPGTIVVFSRVAAARDWIRQVTSV